VSEGWEPVPSGDQPAFGAWNTVGGQWRWSQIHCRRSPGPRSGALVDSRRRGPVEPAGRPAVEHGPGRNRPRRPHFTRPERTGCTRADPEAATTVHPDRTRRRRHELPPAVRRSDARHHSGGSATETNIRPFVPTDDRHRMFPTAGSGRRDVKTGRCPGTSLPVLVAGSLGRSRRRAPMRSASRVVRPATTLPGVCSRPAPGSPPARTGEPAAVSP
jgi:hypothetical protein